VHFSVNFCFSEAAECFVLMSQLHFTAGKVELIVSTPIKIIYDSILKVFNSIDDDFKPNTKQFNAYC
jgi:hypothetical protein